jgi:hypothetical protein
VDGRADAAGQHHLHHPAAGAAQRQRHRPQRPQVSGQSALGVDANRRREHVESEI